MEPEAVSIEEKTLAGREQICFDAYALIFVLREDIRVQTPQGQVWARSNDAVLLQPERSYELSAPNGARVVTLLFSRKTFYQSCLPVIEGCPLLAEFFIHEQQSGMSYLHFETLTGAMLDSVRQMGEEYGRHGAYYEMVLLCRLMNLLLEMSRGCRVNAVMTSAPDARMVQKVIGYIIAHCNETSLKDVATAFNYHPNTISAMVKKQTGKTFQEFRQQIRISHAARLISQEGYSVAQAAQMCGYANMTNFYVQFEKEFGVKPGDFARAQRA